MTRRAFAALLIILLAGPAYAGSQAVATHAALSTVSPYATQVGLSILKRGGNAIDATVAVAFALAVAHPQAGNLGGGGFLLYYDAKSKAVWSLDFREVAPLGATRDMFAKEPAASQTGALAIAVPGTVAGLDAMHERFGTLKWKELIAPAARLARDGIKTDATLEADLAAAREKRHIEQFGATAALFFPKDKPLPAGSTLVQADLANTLERIATFGARELYEGDTAKKLIENVRTAGGLLGYRDLRDYAPVWRSPIRLQFRGYDIYTMAPPSAGGLVIGESLNILSGYDLNATGFQTPASIHLLVEAMRRAYIDRNKYLGDPSSARIPYRELLSSERASQWRASIDAKKNTPTHMLAEPGTNVAEGQHTTHFTIVDEQGNVAAMTTTLNDNFGSGFIVPGLGFFLNNEMDDFTSAPGKPNRYGLVQGTANAIEPGKRMASSMSPTIVLKNDKPYLALGTRGGPAIPTSVLQVLLNVLVYKKPLAEAVAAPRYHQQALPEDIAFEQDRAPKALLDALNAMGHGVAARDSIGDVHAILIESGKLTAVADPRAGGAAGGY
ncbi:MAG TPA: gamma-glutamyltransferase [Thermoanaerobaculia bacterium]|nr:gamma-glutamyltransferase [Thermoanaerobaculia bacterium]